MKLKSSFAYVVFFLYRFGFLFGVIPLQKVIFEKLPPKIAIYIYRSDICALVLLCVWAFFSFRQIYAYTSHSKLLIKKGVFVVRESVFKNKTLHVTHLSRGIFLRLCKACKVQVFSSRAGCFLYLDKKECRHLLDEKVCPSFKNTLLSSLVFSAGFSGALTGLLSLAPLLRNIAGILGEKQTRSILSYADLWVAAGYTAAPPFLRILSSLFFFAWLTGAVVEFFHHFNLRLAHTKNSILIEHGLIKRHTLKINKNAVSVLAQRQSILLYLCGLFTLEAYVSYAKEHRLPLLLASKKSRCRDLIKSLGFPYTENTLNYIKPHANVMWGYTWKPILFLFLLSVSSILTDALTPFHTEPHLALFLALWGVVWFLFSFVAHRRSILHFGPDSLILRCTKGLSFLEVSVPLAKVTAIRVTQNIFQKRKGVCHLYVYIPSGRRQRFLIKHIEKSKTAQLTKA